jgi:hypothetical protein
MGLIYYGFRGYEIMVLEYDDFKRSTSLNKILKIENK